MNNQQGYVLSRKKTVIQPKSIVCDPNLPACEQFIDSFVSEWYQFRIE